jgi:hypothetical protein
MKNQLFLFPHIKWTKVLFNIVLISILSISAIQAQENNSEFKPDTLNYSWERFSIKLGGFIAGVSSDIQLSSKELGLGATINLEDALGVTVSTFVVRSEMEYNFGKRRRHTMSLDYFGLLRSAQKVLDSEIEIGDEVFPIGTEVNSKLNLHILKATYDYSFYMDRRVKLGASFGLFIMPTSFSTSALGLSDEAADFVAPLPVLGLKSSFAITPKLYINQSAEFLYLKIGDYKGSITDISMRVEYNIWEHIGLGLGINTFVLNVEAGKKTKAMEFAGRIKTGYSGLFFYGKYYF